MRLWRRGSQYAELTNMDDKHLSPNQVCIAVEDFTGSEAGDLRFSVGEKITIIRESEMMYWYIAKNEKEEIGTVPSNYLELDKPSLPPPPLPAKPKTSAKPPLIPICSYEEMQPTASVKLPKNHKKPNSEEEKQMLILVQREKRKRLESGTPVIATSSYQSNFDGDLNFKLHEELVIIKPAKDLCWYIAHKAHDRSKKGVIPLTHVRPIYVSDEEEEPQYVVPKRPGFERIYEDKNDFLSNSGWFAYCGIPMGKEAHLHCIARKANMSYETFMSTKEAIYSLNYMNEKKFIGKADVLHEEVMTHFEHFGQHLKDIREVDNELCHHTYAAGWKLTIWPLKYDEDIEIEYAKRIIECDSLMSHDGGGLNESMTFTNFKNFDDFWNWLSPN